jgi:hypothetical protein
MVFWRRVTKKWIIQGQKMRRHTMAAKKSQKGSYPRKPGQENQLKNSIHSGALFLLIHWSILTAHLTQFAQGAGGMILVVKHPPSNYEPRSSNSSTTKRKKKVSLYNSKLIYIKVAFFF